MGGEGATTSDARHPAVRRALVVGAARSGRAAAALLARHGAAVVLADDAPERLRELPEGVVASAGDACAGEVGRFDLVVPSPGVPANHPVLVEACAEGVAVLSELELGWRYVDAPVVAVTGTNGKSTTVTLVAAMLEATGARVFAGGNLGSPLCEAAGRPWDHVVVEVSSFQLEWVERFRPHVGALLNLTPDHLDRHGDVATYLATKLRLFRCMEASDFAVFPRGEPWAGQAAGPVRAQVSTFGLSRPAPETLGTWLETASRTVYADDGTAVRLPEAWPIAHHDLLNTAAAVELARRAGADADAMERGLERFVPLAHRLSLVRTVAAVEYWNDSKATNVGAAVASMASFDRPLIVLVGGQAKDSDFGALASAAPGIKLCIAFGRDGGLVQASIGDRVPVERVAGLADAVALARERAGHGDVVLLAPACASFDEFRDYGERGRRFIELVEELEG